MNNVFNKLKQLALRVRAFFPSPVPQGMTEFQEWTQSIIDLYGFPDNDSVRFALATMIMHSGPFSAYVPKRRFAIMIKAGAAKQIAGAVFNEIKQKQIAQDAAVKASPPTLTAVTTPVAADETQH